MDFRRQVKVATLSVGDAFGEMSLVTGEPRSATAVASTETRVWLLLKDDFDRLIASSPRLAGAVAGLAKERISVLRARGEVPEEEAARWSARAARHVDEELLLPTATEIREAASEYSGAPLAIWLGSLLDGLAESIVIGASLTHVGVSASLLAGVFLSNFPEALSSSAAMRQNNVRFGRIFWMWTSLLALGGGGAALGNLFLVGASPSAFTVVQGVTAGAMLTMVAETMLPEAFHKGGAITGITTLLGFLVALFFKTLG